MTTKISDDAYIKLHAHPDHYRELRSWYFKRCEQNQGDQGIIMSDMFENRPDNLSGKYIREQIKVLANPVAYRKLSQFLDGVYREEIVIAGETVKLNFHVCN